jgi:hypothetical protein
LSWIVLRATRSVRPISRALTPSWCSRNICRNCRMVSSLLAGIKSSSPMIEGGLMPESLTRRKTPPTAVQVAGFKSERWPDSSRNAGRL